MKVLMAGDVVGEPGRRALAQVVTALRRDGKADFVVANAENAAGGRGVTPQLAEEILAAGVDVITLGDHTWDQKELRDRLEHMDRVLRPANFPPACPGRGWLTCEVGGAKISVVNLVGRVFMGTANDCPFRTVDALLQRKPELGRVILVDLHAEATSEKIVMGRFLDGRVSAVVGTHTHVQTSDEAILAQGTAYITDLGMTGAKDSALGRDLESVTSMFLTGMPAKFEVARNDVVLEGLLIDLDMNTGRARQVKRIRQRIDS